MKEKVQIVQAPTVNTRHKCMQWNYTSIMLHELQHTILLIHTTVNAVSNLVRAT